MTDDLNWYIAEVIMEILVTGDDRNVVHRNHFLISSSSNEEAYSKARSRGKSEETEYKNSAGKDVRIRFIGLTDIKGCLDHHCLEQVA